MRGLYQNNFIPAIVLFAVGVSVFVILFFYSTGFYLIKHPTFENLNGVTVTLTAIMLLLTIAFVFIVGWLAKRYFIKLFWNNRILSCFDATPFDSKKALRLGSQLNRKALFYID